MAVEQFTFQATDASGKVTSGKVDAPSKDAVVAQLRARGLMPLDVNPISKTGLNTEIRIPGLEKPVKTDVLAVFAKQMAGLLNAGLPLLRSLVVLEDQAEDKKLKAALTKEPSLVDPSLRSNLEQILPKHQLLQQVYDFRTRLFEIWNKHVEFNFFRKIYF